MYKTYSSINQNFSSLINVANITLINTYINNTIKTELTTNIYTNDNPFIYILNKKDINSNYHNNNNLLVKEQYKINETIFLDLINLFLFGYVYEHNENQNNLNVIGKHNLPAITCVPLLFLDYMKIFDNVTTFDDIYVDKFIRYNINNNRHIVVNVNMFKSMEGKQSVDVPLVGNFNVKGYQNLTMNNEKILKLQINFVFDKVLKNDKILISNSNNANIQNGTYIVYDVYTNFVLLKSIDDKIDNNFYNVNNQFVASQIDTILVNTIETNNYKKMLITGYDTAGLINDKIGRIKLYDNVSKTSMWVPLAFFSMNYNGIFWNEMIAVNY